MDTAVYTHDESGQRADVHRPSAINPGDYEYKHVNVNRKDQIKGGPAGTCHHCGKAIVWEVVWLHKPSGNLVTFGDICTGILGMSNDRIAHEMVMLKRRAKNERDALLRAQDTNQRRESMKAEYPELCRFLDGANARTETGFIASLIWGYDKYGSLLPRQITALQKVLADRAEKAAERASQPVPTTPLAEGRYIITGEIVATKYDAHSNFPGRRMTILLPDGNKVYGTMPKAIETATDDWKGLGIEFTAQVVRSNKDEHFGFFKRPSAAKIL